MNKEFIDWKNSRVIGVTRLEHAWDGALLAAANKIMNNPNKNPVVLLGELMNERAPMPEDVKQS